MKRFASVMLIGILAVLNVQAQSTKVLIKTSMGDITVMLYDDTPLHKDNFIELVENKFYDDILFHRVISEFMIQVGDPKTKNEKAVDYTIPAEIRKNHFHKKGALSAARMGDQVNPERASSGSQFYIVQGKKVTAEELLKFGAGRPSPFTDEEAKAYMEDGGTPHLDFGYTVFGEVTKGLDVVEKISLVQCNRSVPVKDVKIISARIIK